MLEPQNCNFMFCLPLTIEQFYSDLMNLSKDFVRELLSSYKEDGVNYNWSNYFSNVIKPYQKLKKQFERYGFVFHESVTLENFKNIINNFHVNILFSHCKHDKNEAIEFFDRLVYKDEFVDSIPRTYNKVIDLSVCNPEQTALELKDKRRLAIVKSSNISIKINYWLYFYGILFDIINKRKVKFYSNALELAISQFNQKK